MKLFRDTLKGFSLQGAYSYLKTRRVMMFLLLPFVIAGVLYLYRQNRISNIYATDPLVVTYNGGPPPLPMFEVFGMVPGESTEKIFNVENDSPNLVNNVTLQGIKTDEDKDFAEVLDLEIVRLPASTIYNGKLEDFFDGTPVSLGAFTAFSNKDFRVKVTFPFEAGDEYQEAMVKFNLKWVASVTVITPTGNPPSGGPTQGPTPIPDGIVLPDECKSLQGKIVSVIQGTQDEDKLKGDGNGNLIIAKEGHDKVEGMGGDDCIVLGDGNDKAGGGSGNDIVIGGPGNDDIETDSGNDTVFGGDGNDDIELGSGNDKAWGNAGNDDIDGEEGDDEVYGGDGNDTLRGGSGIDKLFGELGNDNLHGNSGNDILDGGTGTDTLHGNLGTDTCQNDESNSSCEI